MPYDLQLPQALKKARWKVKIYDFERLEPPHITILFKHQKWRLSLRDGTFMPGSDSPNQIPDGVKSAIEQAWEVLEQEWDRMHPDNPISREDDE